MATALDNKKLRALVRESVREAVSAEFIKLGAFLLPYVSKAEQKDIEKQYSKPSRKAATVYRLRT
ncbi:MAG: hypothetical protein A3J54_01625 [Candidatus Ryanbacteria bacterium RIFCSPHIGHO2_02_FULL_45_13b]|uniref:Uncharacterized protein n=1 Tax=Candidatus Ryanbacteria bacterium RIFCSPHIGHO2_02_FULL_45_13b TaxID=1802117 RepID=A0A1G2G8T5_9BACT|nr:MAG: hypothetical protein A3J54_01625 [Candidatus Ryanbacteria bacterium RIFCSPHIGHO2_02_FULL_45_13b]